MKKIVIVGGGIAGLTAGIKNFKANSKEVVWFEESAHLCQIEEQEKFALEMQKACFLIPKTKLNK